MRIQVCTFCLLLTAACGSDPGAPSGSDSAAAVIKQYVLVMRANSSDVVDKLQALKSAVADFVGNPTADGLVATQQTWLDARPAYGQLEVGRFYNGPVDEVNGGANEWPIDENFIDYTAGNPNGGIINDVSGYPSITPQVLANSDEVGGIENLSTGFHAIEFLLWGQRLDQTEGPGERPYTDYVDGGTASNQGRRRAYLQAATDLLLSDLAGVMAEWDLAQEGSYGAEMVAQPSDEGLAKIVRGMTSMAVSELYYERMTDPFLTQNRKDEESCFSESTQVDLAANMLGVQNVYLGRYGDLSGASVSDLVLSRNPDLDAHLRKQMETTRSAIDAIPPPFDHAVIAPEGSEPHEAVKGALDTFKPMVDSLHQMAELFDIKVNI
jgi:putative iron-regulated protein